MLVVSLLVGDKIGLHPVAVIFAVLAGGQLFGFVGILLGLPIAAVVMVLLKFAHQNYLHSKLYGDEQDISLSNKDADMPKAKKTVEKTINKMDKKPKNTKKKSKNH